MFYGGKAFHVFTFLRVRAGEDPVASFRQFHSATTGGEGGRWIYAGKAKGPRWSSDASMNPPESGRR